MPIEYDQIIDSEPESPEEKRWAAYLWEMEKEQLKRYEEAAKFLTGIISVCATIFIKFDTTAFENMSYPYMMYVGLLCWLFALVQAFWVWVPRGYDYSSHSIQTFMDAHAKMLSHKKWVFWSAFVCFYVGLVLLMFVFFYH